MADDAPESVDTPTAPVSDDARKRQRPAHTPLPVADRRVLPHLWDMTRHRRAALAGVLVLFMIEAAAAVVFPLVIGTIVDAVTLGTEAAGSTVQVAGIPEGFSALVLPLLLLIAAALASGGLAWIGGVMLARTVETLVAQLREDYVAAALSLPRAVIEAAGTGDVVTRASDDIAEITGTLPSVLPRLAVSVFTIVAVGASLGGLHPAYLLGFLLTVPLYALTVRWYLGIAPATYAKTRAVQSRRGEHVLGTLTHLPTVVAHGMTDRQLERIGRSTWSTVRWALRTRIVQNRLFGRLNTAQAVGLLAVLGIGVWLASTGTSTPGQVTAAALLFLRIVAPIEGLLFVMDDAQAAYASCGRLVGVIEYARTVEGVETARKIRTAEAVGTVEEVGTVADPDSAPEADAARVSPLVHLRGVGFEHVSGHRVLRDIEMRIDPGEVVAVVGATGSGKSTLAHLVTGVHAPTVGTVERSIGEEQIAAVSQEPHVFVGTLSDNLTLLGPLPSNEGARGALDPHGEGRGALDPHGGGQSGADVHSALAEIGARSWVETLSDGLDTVVGFGGHPLTAAQAQHVALARVLLLDPPLVVLDEATADSDSADTGMLDQATAATIDGRAALVIAHRLTQAQVADRILVMEDGAIVEQGTHTALVAANGAYAALWHAWSAGSE